MAPHTILFIAANPVGMDRPALDEQACALQIELERASRRDCFQLETRWAAQPLDLLREMVKHKPTIVHFCGGRVIGGRNGAPPAGVYFQAADGHAQLVSAKALASAFDAAGAVKLVVLDACYSEEHAAAVAAHIDCVVGMAGETVDGAATSSIPRNHGRRPRLLVWRSLHAACSGRLARAGTHVGARASSTDCAVPGRFYGIVIDTLRPLAASAVQSAGRTGGWVRHRPTIAKSRWQQRPAQVSVRPRIGEISRWCSSAAPAVASGQAFRAA